ncbi:MAG: CoA transferase, partial [Armatimonadetes bacterium]|nr:CoA transferase [Armatimonadota bacterium]
WRRFCEAIVPDLLDDPRYATNRERVARRKELVERLARLFEMRPTGAWTEVLDGAGVPNGPILTIAETLAHEQVRHRQMLMEINHPTVGRIKQTGVAVKLSETPGSLRSAPPTLGQHTAAILRELGYTEGDIAQFRRDGVI